MKNKTSLESKSNKVIRRFARYLGLFLILLTLAFAIPELITEQNPNAEPTRIDIILTGALMLVGLALAWKWELIGGLISLIGFIGVGILNPDAVKMPMMYLFPITAILFLISWRLGKSKSKKEEDIGYGD
jgi:hypothetical protein